MPDPGNQGPLGGATNAPAIDHGTSVRNPSRAPVTTGITFDLPDDLSAWTYTTRKGGVGFNFSPRYFLKGVTDTGNTGESLIDLMKTIGHEEQVYLFKIWSKNHGEDISSYEARPKDRFAKIGSRRHWRSKPQGTTNCSTAILDALVRFFGGPEGAINGISAIDEHFDDFNAEWQGRDWILVFEKYGLGFEVDGIENARRGDVLSTGNHRVIITGTPKINSAKKTVRVEIIEANLPTGAMAIKTRTLNKKLAKTRSWKIGRFYDYSTVPLPGG